MHLQTFLSTCCISFVSVNSFIIGIASTSLLSPKHAQDNFNVRRNKSTIAELKEIRSNRIGLLQSNFPFAHYVTLFSFGFAMCLVFLIDVNCGKFASDEVTLKIHWAMTLGTCTILSTTCCDSHDPFEGSHAVRLCIKLQR